MNDVNSTAKKALESKVQALLAELYAIDPILKENERHMEALVTEMLSSHPHPAPTHAFIGHLRDHLIHKIEPPLVPEKNAGSAASKKPHGVLFWTFRFMPVGVLVAVVLMIYAYPKGSGTPIQPSPTPSQKTAPTEEAAKDTDDEGAAGGDAETMMMSLPADWNPAPQAPMGSVVIVNSRPGAEAFISVVLPRAGYIAVYTDQGGRPGRFLGVSRLLPPGPSDNIRVLLQPPAIEGEMLYAELRESNGDTRFDPATDPQILDETGAVISGEALVAP